MFMPCAVMVGELPQTVESILNKDRLRDVFKLNYPCKHEGTVFLVDTSYGSI